MTVDQFMDLQEALFLTFAPIVGWWLAGFLATIILLSALIIWLGFLRGMTTTQGQGP